MKVFVLFVMIVVCTGRPHRRHRRHHLSRARRNHERMCPLVTAALPSEFPLGESQFAQIRFDTEGLLRNLACRLDTSCSQSLLDKIAVIEPKQYQLSHTKYPRFIERMLGYMASFHEEFKDLVSQLSELQSNLVLSSADPLIRLSNLLVNDLADLMCYIHQSTAVLVPRARTSAKDSPMDMGTTMVQYISALKRFQAFLKQCITRLNNGS